MWLLRRLFTGPRRQYIYIGEGSAVEIGYWIEVMR